MFLKSRLTKTQDYVWSLRRKNSLPMWPYS